MKFKDLLFSILIVSFCSCVNKPEHHYKYTVWVGSAAFSVGYDTDSIKNDSDSYFFTSKGGEKFIVPKHSINKINVNY